MIYIFSHLCDFLVENANISGGRGHCIYETVILKICLPIIWFNTLHRPISRTGQWAAHVWAVGHLCLRRQVLLWVLPVRFHCSQTLVLSVAHKTLKPVQVVWFTHVVDAPLSALQPLQQTQVSDLAGSFVLQIARVLRVVLIQGLYELRQVPWRGEIVNEDSGVIVRQPVGHWWRAPVNGHTALVHGPPQLLRHVVGTQAVLQGQVELITADETHEAPVFTSGCAGVLQIVR